MEYKYDVAVSLCKNDVEFARKLVATLNPSLKIFFYEDRQEELISQSGPEKFGEIFKKQSRVVVLLSRNEWSESFYTDIERNGIIDRTSVRNQGYNFLFVIPMEPGQVPSWYPTTRIFADPRRFSIEELGRFIEFKVTDEGGRIETLTSERFSNLFMERLNLKRQLVKLQLNNEATIRVRREIELVKNAFDAKVKIFTKSAAQFHSTSNPFNSAAEQAEFGIGKVLMICEIRSSEDERTGPINTTQAVILRVRFEKRGERGFDEIKSTTYRFYYSGTVCGWSIPIEHPSRDHRQFQYLFFDPYNGNYYDLKNPVSTETLIDTCFLELWQFVQSEFDSLLS